MTLGPDRRSKWAGSFSRGKLSVHHLVLDVSGPFVIRLTLGVIHWTQQLRSNHQGALVFDVDVTLLIRVQRIPDD